jgi:hypothetical protein
MEKVVAQVKFSWNLRWCVITNNSDVGCDFVISNLEIASILTILTKKYFKIDLFIMF